MSYNKHFDQILPESSDKHCQEQSGLTQLLKTISTSRYSETSPGVLTAQWLSGDPTGTAQHSELSRSGQSSGLQIVKHGTRFLWQALPVAA